MKTNIKDKRILAFMGSLADQYDAATYDRLWNAMESMIRGHEDDELTDVAINEQFIAGAIERDPEDVQQALCKYARHLVEKNHEISLIWERPVRIIDDDPDWVRVYRKKPSWWQRMKGNFSFFAALGLMFSVPAALGLVFGYAFVQGW